MNSRLLLLLLVATLGWVGHARAQSATQITANTPIVNFRLPTFTPDGHRSWLIRGSEAVVREQNLIDVHELALTIFTGDASDRIETMILSPVAQVAPNDQLARGPQSIRLINDALEATGTGWEYIYREKKVSLHRSVRVTIHGELKDLLK